MRNLTVLLEAAYRLECFDGGTHEGSHLCIRLNLPDPASIDSAAAGERFLTAAWSGRRCAPRLMPGVRRASRVRSKGGDLNGY